MLRAYTTFHLEFNELARPIQSQPARSLGDFITHRFSANSACKRTNKLQEICCVVGGGRRVQQEGDELRELQRENVYERKGEF